MSNAVETSRTRPARTHLRRAEREENGFTLIELLIVIVILGILAAVVVFAVNGIQNRGTASACKADVETVTVAAEAFDAQNGRYADTMDELVSAGFLHSVPSTSNYTIDYSADNTSKTPSVSVSSTFCPDPNASGAQTSGSPSSGAPSSSADQLSAYCSGLKPAFQHFRGLDFNALDEDQFQQTVSGYEALAAIAPDDVSDAWHLLVSATEKMQRIVAATGLSRADLLTVANGQLPDGFTQEQVDQLQQDLQGPIQGADGHALGDGLRAIFQHAHDVCGVNL